MVKRALGKHAAATRLQCLARAHLAYVRAHERAQEVVEKILEPRMGRHYYYNKVLKTSSWSKPRLFRDSTWADIEEASPTYTPLQAAVMVQCRYRVVKAVERLRYKLAQWVVQTSDPETGAVYVRARGRCCCCCCRCR